MAILKSESKRMKEKLNKINYNFLACLEEEEDIINLKWMSWYMEINLQHQQNFPHPITS
jgi:hypothetical protein